MKDKIVKEPFWNDLTYITQQQAIELIRRHDTYERSKKMSFIFLLISLIAITIILLPQAKDIDPSMIIFFILLALLIPLIPVMNYLSTAKKNYDTHREIIIKTLSGQFCTHSGKCKCKDDFVQFLMEKGSINLVF